MTGDFQAALTRVIDQHARELAERKEVLAVCAMVDKWPALRWVEWRQDNGDVAHILISGGQGLSGRWVSGFREEAPKFKTADGLW